MTWRFSHKTYQLPLRAPLRTAHGPWAEREGIIVRLEDEAGRVGFGEIAPIPWFGTETMAEAEEICRKFGATVSDELLDAVPAAVRLRAVCPGGGPKPAGGRNGGNTRLPVAALLPAGRDVLAGFARENWRAGFWPSNGRSAWARWTMSWGFSTTCWRRCRPTRSCGSTPTGRGTGARRSAGWGAARSGRWSLWSNRWQPDDEDGVAGTWRWIIP